MFGVDKEWLPGADLRPATEEEKKLYLKYCSVAKESHDLYVSTGIITDIIHHGYGIFDENNTQKGIASIGGGIKVGGTMGMSGGYAPWRIMVDLKNGYTHEIKTQSVLFTWSKDLIPEIEQNSPCKLLWIKKHKGYEFIYVIADGATEKTPLTWCKMCAKQMRTEDVLEGGICPYCHKHVDGSFMEFLKS